MFSESLSLYEEILKDAIRTSVVSVSAMLVYIYIKKISLKFLFLSDIFFVSFCPAANPGTYLMVFLVVALLLCLLHQIYIFKEVNTLQSA